jgi:hypothetical protein
MSLAVGGVLVSVFDLVSLHCQCDGVVMSAALFHSGMQKMCLNARQQKGGSSTTRHTAHCCPRLHGCCMWDCWTGMWNNHHVE